MKELPSFRIKESIRAGAVAMLTTLAWAAPPDAGDAPGPAEVSASGVRTASPERPPPALRLQIDPPGALRGRVYQGALRGATGGPVFEDATAVRVRALRPESLAGLRLVARTDAEVRLECQVTESAADTEALFVTLEAGERRQEVSILLRTTEPLWDPAWRPIAVAPADTAVADSTCEVLLDVGRSHHPAGLDAMHFRWAVDDGSVVIKGGPVTSTRLAAGRHTIVLVAEDSFGYVSRDTMRVQVGPTEK